MLKLVDTTMNIFYKNGIQTCFSEAPTYAIIVHSPEAVVAVGRLHDDVTTPSVARSRLGSHISSDFVAIARLRSHGATSRLENSHLDIIHWQFCIHL